MYKEPLIHSLLCSEFVELTLNKTFRATLLRGGRFFINASIGRFAGVCEVLVKFAGRYKKLTGVA